MAKRSSNWFVWAWADADGAIKFLGIGRSIRGEHPAAVMYRDRLKLDESPIVRWLRECHHGEPKRLAVGASGTTRAKAEAIYAENLRLFRSLDTQLLSTRPLASYVAGSKARPVIFNRELWFPSLRAAAEHMGCSSGTMTRRLQRNTEGWEYATDS